MWFPEAPTGIMMYDIVVFVPSADETTDEAIDCSMPYDNEGYVAGALNYFLGAPLRFKAPGRFILCYKFMYADLPPADRPNDLSFGKYTDIRIGALSIDSAAPIGTASDCTSTITVTGSGYTTLGADQPSPTCRFGSYEAPYASSAAVDVQDDYVTCSITGGELTSTNMYLDFGTMLSVEAIPTFTVYDQSTVSAFNPAPRGGAYNLDANITLNGTGLVDYGIGCRFAGTVASESGAVASSTFMSCLKPAFPDSYRSLVGEISLDIALNGQCWTTSTASTIFTVYNAYIESIEPSGAPATVPFDITVNGGGFLGLAGATCTYTQDDTSVTTALQVTADAQAICSSPASNSRRQLASPGRGLTEVEITGLSTYEVTIELNGP